MAWEVSFLPSLIPPLAGKNSPELHPISMFRHQAGEESQSSETLSSKNDKINTK